MPTDLPMMTSTITNTFNITSPHEEFVYKPDDKGMDWQSYIIAISSTMVFLIGTFGNGSVVMIISRAHNMRTTTNLGILSLAVADLFVLLICMPSALIELYSNGVWYFGATMCKYLVN